MAKAIWNSTRGYSKPNELVELTGQSQGDLVQIKSAADPQEKANYNVDCFYYWVQQSELQIKE